MALTPKKSTPPKIMMKQQEMPGKEFKIQPFKMSNNFKVDSNKQMSEVGKSIQDPDQRVNGVDQNVSEKAEKWNSTRGESSARKLQF